MQVRKNSLFSRHTLLIVSLCAISGIVISFLMNSLKMNPKKRQSAFLNQTAPAFKAIKVDRHSEVKHYIDSKSFKDQPLIIHFWASWCSTCSEDGSYLNKLYPELQEKGINLVGIAISDDYESALKLQRTKISNTLLVLMKTVIWQLILE